MLAVISPARNIRPSSFDGLPTERPQFLQQALQIVQVVQGYNLWELESLADVRAERVLEISDYYRTFSADAAGTHALLSFWGAAFRSMNPQGFTREEFLFAHGHLRVLSALYGLLRPADGILPYRLGLTKDFLVGSQNLYEFWGERLYRALYENGDTVVSLTSNEYAKLITPYLRPQDRFIQCRFLVRKHGHARGTVSTMRTARGLMARYIVQNRVTDPDELRGFDLDGYRFSGSRSDPLHYVFIKEHAGPG